MKSSIKKFFIIIMSLMIMNVSIGLTFGYIREQFSAYARVSTRLLNVRNIPTAKKGSGSEVIGRLDEDTVVNVTERYQEDYDAPEWYYVEASNGIKGWVSGKYIEISDSSPPTSTAENYTNNLASPVRQNKQNNKTESSNGKKSSWEGFVAIILIWLIWALLERIFGGKVITDGSKPIFRCQHCGATTNDPFRVFGKNCTRYINGKSISAPHEWHRIN